jgi:hypothetical protein
LTGGLILKRAIDFQKTFNRERISKRVKKKNSSSRSEFFKAMNAEIDELKIFGIFLEGIQKK